MVNIRSQTATIPHPAVSLLQNREFYTPLVNASQLDMTFGFSVASHSIDYAFFGRIVSVEEPILIYRPKLESEEDELAQVWMN